MNSLYKRNGFLLFSLIFVVAILVIFASLLMPHWSIWVDETTQLNGLSLNPISVTRWLTGGEHYFIGFPSDRMPPLSYWLGMAWASIFGLNEMSMRFLGLSMTCLAAIFIVMAGNRAFGSRAGLVAGLLFVLSPNIIEQAINIRSYPMLLLFSSIAFYFFIRIVEDSKEYKKRWAVGLALSLIAAIYTHFFGVVFAAVLLLVILILLWQQNGKEKPIFISAIAVAISIIGLLPFVLGAITLTPHVNVNMDPDHVYNILKLAYRLFSYPSMIVNHMDFMAVNLSYITLLITFFVSKERSNTTVKGLFIIFVIGFCVESIGEFLFSKFSPSSPRYNIWLIPGLCLLLSSCLVIKERKVRIISCVFIFITCCVNVYGDIRFVTHGEYFSLVRFREVESLVRKAGVGHVTMIYDGGDWASVSYPASYVFGQELQQYLADDKTIVTGRIKKISSRNTGINMDTIDSKYLFVARVIRQNARQINEQIEGGDKLLQDGPLEKLILASGHWKFSYHRLFVAFEEVDLDVFIKKE